MTNNYIIAFSSFYKAAYAQEKLSEGGIRTIERRLPPEVLHTCGYALTLKTDSQKIRNAVSILEKSEITHRGIFIEHEENGKTIYKRVV